jgi:hypothetical protein
MRQEQQQSKKFNSSSAWQCKQQGQAEQQQQQCRGAIASRSPSSTSTELLCASLYAVYHACRVANIRKHQLLKPEIKVLMTAVDSITPSNYVFEYLEVESADMQQMNLQLGFPANIVHVVRPNSPLYSLSLQVRRSAHGRLFYSIAIPVSAAGQAACLSAHGSW